MTSPVEVILVPRGYGARRLWGRECRRGQREEQLTTLALDPRPPRLVRALVPGLNSYASSRGVFGAPTPPPRYVLPYCLPVMNHKVHNLHQSTLLLHL